MATAFKYISVYFLSGIKFILGPTLGIACGLPVIVVILLTSLGMMTTIYLFTYLGDELRTFIGRFRKKDRKLFSKKSRRFVKIRRKFGIEGVCLLTPLLLTPPGGGLIVHLLRADRSMMLKWMWISALLWSTVITLILKYATRMLDGMG